MKVLTFNRLLSTYGKNKTKIIVVRKNELFKKNSIWTAKEIDEYLTNHLKQLHPYQIHAKQKQNESMYNKREKIKLRIVSCLELKNNE